MTKRAGRAAWPARAMVAAALAASGLAAALPGAAAMPSPAGTDTPAHHTVRVCTAHPRPGFAACQAIAIAGADGRALSTAAPLQTGFTPSDVQAAYGLTGLRSGGRTVAIVDAYGYSHLEADLALYRHTYDLRPCTTANGCLTIMDQRGGTDYPPHNSGWALEQALDVDAVSATCPDCHIIVVQAKDASLRNLGIAEVLAAHQKLVVAISNSYLGHDRRALKQYDHPGIAITVATGDSGYRGGAYPASDPHVVAVSGTSITRDASRRGYSETAWGGTGSGCADSNHAPPWQEEARTTCRTRAIGDVSAAANPAFGGLNICFHGQFWTVGGTSEATPIIAAVYALSGRTGGYPARYPYHDPSHLYDITQGRNGGCGAPLCEARKGWDGVTGIGTPHGVKSF